MSYNHIVLGVAILLLIVVAYGAVGLRPDRSEHERPKPVLVSFDDAISRGGGLIAISDDQIGTHPRATLIHPASDDAALAAAIGSSVLALQRYWGSDVVVGVSQQTVVRGKPCGVILISPDGAVTQR